MDLQLFDGSNTTTIKNHPTSLPHVTNAPNGTYSITALADANCTGTGFGSPMVVSASPAATANAGGPYTTCGTGPIAIAALANGPGSWSSVGNIGSFSTPNTLNSTYTYPTSVTLLTTRVTTWTTTDPDGPGPCPVPVTRPWSS
ncbi:MAG: hypothetical protein IPP26_01515 [Flavobacteriales bacterium]|nr:hypothetical protein [Flavobacteriales bacterium]